MLAWAAAASLCYTLSQNLVLLNDGTYGTRQQYIILFVRKSGCPRCPEAIAELERVAVEIPRQIAVVDCNDSPQTCAELNVTKYPSLKCHVKNVQFSYGEPTFSAGQMAAFIQITLSPIMVQTSSVADFHDVMSQHQINKYFVQYAPQSAIERLEELYFLYKGKMRVVYFERDYERLVAFRQGLKATYKGDFVQNETDRFIRQTLIDLFPKLSREVLQQTIDAKLLLAVFIYDQNNAEHEERLRWAEKLTGFCYQSQNKIGQNYQFAHVDHKEPFLKELLARHKIQVGNGVQVLIIKNGGFYVNYSFDYDAVEVQLEDVADGRVKMKNIR